MTGERVEPKMSGMSVDAAVAGRRSIRAFVDRPVDAALLRDILARAQMAPSGYNFQPWEGVLVGGAALTDLSRQMQASVPQEPEEYRLVPPALPQLYADRRDAISAERYDSLGLAREDKTGRAAFHARNYAFFGAPVALFTFVPRVMGPPQWSDVGMWLQTIMLLLHGAGLGSCPQESLYVHGRLIKRALGVDDATHLFFCGLAIGWPDPDAPVNHYRRPRADPASVVRVVGL